MHILRTFFGASDSDRRRCHWQPRQVPLTLDQVISWSFAYPASICCSRPCGFADDKNDQNMQCPEWYNHLCALNCDAICGGSTVPKNCWSLRLPFWTCLGWQLWHLHLGSHWAALWVILSCPKHPAIACGTSRGAGTGKVRGDLFTLWGPFQAPQTTMGHSLSMASWPRGYASPHSNKRVSCNY